MFGNICFENTMKNKTKCDCPMECNSISYSFTLYSSPFNAEKMCPSDAKTDFLMKEFYENSFPPKFIKKLIQFRDNISSRETDQCKRYIQYRSEISFRLASNTMPVTVISRRLSFFDKMSAFGKCEKKLIYIKSVK